MAIYNNNMTRIYYDHRRAYTSTKGKYRALLAQGFDEASAMRMATSPDIPQVYGPTNRSRITEQYNY